MDRETLEDAVNLVYDAALGDAAWQEAVAAVVGAHDAERAMLFTPNLEVCDGGLWALHQVPEEIQRRYVGEYRERDLWLERGVAKGEFRVGNTLLGQELVSAADLKRSAIYADVLRHAGLFHLCSTVLSDGSDPRAPPALFAIFRGEAGVAFSRAEQRRFNGISRHVARAMTLWFERPRPGGPEALADNLVAPALWVREDLGIAWMNRAAEAWVRCGRIRSVGGRLEAIDDLGAELAPAVQRAAQGLPPMDLGPKGKNIAVEIVPARVAQRLGHIPPRPKGVLLLVREHRPAADLIPALKRTFRFTAAEAELAAALADGVSIAEYAARRVIMQSTARTQLKMVLAKAGVHRQSELLLVLERMRPLLATRAE